MTVPTVFTAVDKFSSVVGKMGKSLGGFVKGAAFGISRLNEKFNSFFKLGDLSKQFLSLASTAAIAALIISGIKFSAKSLMDYDKAIAQLHNTLYSVGGGGFAAFQKSVEQTARSTDSSTIDIANSFRTIAGLDQSLAKTPGSLAAVSKAALTLSRATDSELTPATEGLVGVMHIFGLQANQANRIVNVLAAAQVNGAGTLEDQVENYKKWGVVAKSANITLEQSAGINAVFGQYLQKGTESATTLRTAIIRLQKAGAGYKSGIFNINDALGQTIGFYNKIKNQRGKDDFLIKLFGPRGASAGRILLDNAQKINDVTKSVTGTNTAFDMASRNMNTVYGLLDRIKNKWVTFITTNDDSNKAMNKFKDILRYVIINFDSIISTAITVVKWFLIFKTAVYAINVSLGIYNGIAAIMAATTTAVGAAASTSAVQVSGFGGMISTVSTELAIADTAAAGFFATLSAFVIPAALVALGGLAIWKVLQGNKEVQAHSAAVNREQTFNRNSPEGLISQFGNKKEENAYQSWWLSQVKGHPNMPETSFSRSQFDKQFGAGYDTKKIFDPSLVSNGALLAPATHAQVTHSTATTQNNLSIDINDPGNHVAGANMQGPTPIKMNITSTIGKQKP